MEPSIRFGGIETLGTGPSALTLIRTGDPGRLRPWLETDKRGDLTGRVCITTNSLGDVDKDGNRLIVNESKPIGHVNNTPAFFTREAWKKIDQRVMWEAKQRLRFWGEIYGSNPVNIPNGMSIISLQHSVADGNATAVTSMSPVRKGERSRPIMDIGNTPLPITHSDGGFDLREVEVSRNSNIPLDATGVGLSARAVAENIEKLSLGLSGTFTYANGTIYGLTNFPNTITGTLTAPTTGGWVPKTAVDQVLAGILTLENKFFYGPYTLFYANSWSPYMDGDYAAAYAGETLRTRLLKIEKIQRVVNLDYLTNYKMALVQMTPDIVEGVQGMALTTVQWTEGGGFEIVFKVLCIMVPRFRASYSGNAGIWYAVA